MSIINSLDDYDVRVGEPYLAMNVMGNYVVLQDEVLFSQSASGSGDEMILMTEILVDDNPSDKEIFKYKLKGNVRAYIRF